MYELTQLISGLVADTGIMEIGKEHKNKFQLNSTVAAPSQRTKHCSDAQSDIKNLRLDNLGKPLNKNHPKFGTLSKQGGVGSTWRGRMSQPTYLVISF